MLSDVKAGEEGVELITGTDVVVVLQQVQRKALAEAAGADEEEEVVGFFYKRDEVGLVYVVGVFAADGGEVHHAIGDAAAVGEYQFFHHCILYVNTYIKDNDKDTCFLRVSQRISGVFLKLLYSS